MDSLTQIVLGIAVAEVCAGKKLQNRGFVYGAILGTIPDLDVVVGKFLNPLDAMMIHRGMSHSLLFILFLSPILGWLIARIEKRRISFKTASRMAFWCLITHPLLDMCTTWGTQILWPLPYRYSLNSIFVIDPLYTIPFMVFLIMVWRTKNNELRTKYTRRCLFLSTGYLLLAFGIKLYALHKFEKALATQNITYNEIMVKPSAFNLILWNANVATKEGYLLGDYSLFDTQPVAFTNYPKNTALEVSLKDNADFKKLQVISEGWYLVTQNKEKVYFNDLRFGLLNDNPDDLQFAFSYQFVDSPQGLKAVEVPKSKMDGKALLKRIFIRLQGN
ncbi:integral membrane protein [Flavobacterium limnosediminis JC2902]|uniref:Integral membrane protein n=1 Tax=Flavobacterium limnosediminis JC2902 TaxID=1341181 RepID=V6SPT7_9FLAO|nr:metal-dependent hydrolase [Flavobacterium limnosediminis]ESU28469.1 integral membrane protein [Flavobacterium limnosediminis JC2902]